VKSFCLFLFVGIKEGPSVFSLIFICFVHQVIFYQLLNSILALYTHCFMPACGKGRLRIKGVLGGIFFGLI
jgi:hypothetical protein